MPTIYNRLRTLNQSHLFLWCGNYCFFLLLFYVNRSTTWLAQRFEKWSSMTFWDLISNVYQNHRPLAELDLIGVVLLVLYFSVCYFFVFKWIYTFNRWGMRYWKRYVEVAKLVPTFICITRTKDNRLIIEMCSQDLNELFDIKGSLIGRELRHTIFNSQHLSTSFQPDDVFWKLIQALDGTNESFIRAIPSFPTLLQTITSAGELKYFEVSYVLSEIYSSEKLTSMNLYLRDKTKEAILQQEKEKSQRLIERQREINAQQRITMENMLHRVEQSIVSFGKKLKVQPNYLNKLSKTFSSISKVGHHYHQAIKSPDTILALDEVREEVTSINKLQESIMSMFEVIENQNQDLAEKIAVIEEQNVALQKADQLKNEFLANTSHELRTPLNGIIGITESMMDGALGPLTQKQTSNLSLVVSCGRKLSNLINDLLEVSKLRYRSLQIAPTSVNLQCSAQVVLELSRHLLGGKNISLQNHVPMDLGHICADEGRLEQILYNLVGNAIKYTHEGEIRIEAHQQSDSVIVSVVDTGIGILKKHQEHIFKNFEQVNREAAHGYYGTGLGLSITKQLVELHGGELQVESEKGQGSHFFFNLPLAKTKVGKIKNNHALIQTENSLLNHRDVVPPVLKEQLIQPHDENQATILIVDDDEVNIQVLQNYLSMKHYNLLIAYHGEEALELVEQESPDLVLLDVMMPGISGYETCQILRRQFDLVSLPVIMLTARSQLKDLIEGFQSGANDYLVKPFFEEELYSRIETLLHAKQSVERLKENKRLTEEIEKRQMAEIRLHTSQRRLARVLDSTEESVICFNEKGKITFYNQSAEKLFGYQNREMLNNNIDILIPEIEGLLYPAQEKPGEMEGILNHFQQKLIVRAIHHNQQERNHEVLITTFTGDHEAFYSIMKPSEASLLNQHHAQCLKPEEIWEKTFAHQKIKLLESTLYGVKEYLDEGGIRLIDELRELEAQFDEVKDYLSLDKEENLRELMVAVMTKSLECWTLFTQKTPLDLAEESQIWKASLDRGTWHTRTLNKYLNITTLPKKPRWRDILRTAKFVLPYCPPDSSEINELTNLLGLLQKKLLPH